ncbi:PD-(D/E)XK nuclease family protein [Jinshanibacter sp. LJY008]|uniref:PD-(D/E)XK nuclease family protein n=1 Tax=Limnobaculum eriocheiris TaxID=2897391 RepID=A0A9X1MYV0_9GAMM|nr:PD-(D/E)XK nuclease family protein [Limnobaculum eriocheiris]MCD1127359.1 PD-(D/E)XK nuclease family protein [Limnobaculum eriocheiris]
MNAIQQHAAALLDSVARWNEVTTLAKLRYQAELAPDFSLMDWLKNDELALSRYLRFLLSPDETHGQSALFLKGFLSLIEKSGHDSPITTGGSHHKVRVDYEVTIDNGRKIDLLLTSSEGVIAIENKPWAADQENQLRDYALWLNKRERPWKLIYLCNNEPGEWTLPDNTPEALKQNILTISWYEVAEWLSECLLRVRAGVVRIFVESLIKYINQSINGEFIMDNSRELSEIIRKDSHSIESAFMIFNQMNEVRSDLINELISDLNKRFIDFPFAVEMSDVDPSSRWVSFCIPLSPDGVYSLCWEFDRTNYNDLYFGISGISQEKEQVAKIGAAISDIFPHMQGKPSKQWSWWSWDLDPQGKNRIPQNWGNDGAVWAKLGERDEDSIFAALCEVILAIHEKLDMNLLR